MQWYIAFKMMQMIQLKDYSEGYLARRNDLDIEGWIKDGLIYVEFWQGDLLRLLRWFGRLECFPPSLMTLVWSLGLTWFNRNDPFSFFLPPHKHSMLCAFTNTHIAMHSEKATKYITKSITPQNVVYLLK